jgi:hypothetical protein
MLYPVLLIGLIATLMGCSATYVGDVDRGEPSSADARLEGRQPVLVELFTSEGCSSCPPADKNLAFLNSQQPVAKAEIVTLAFHVDYWDRLGWKDRFSSPLYSRRQENYSHAFELGSNYTPQMVVDGTTEFVGSNSGKASDAITKAIDSPKATIEISTGAHQWTVKITNVPSHRDAAVYAAIAEDGISTRVERGENSGKTLEHVSVVRELMTLGTLAADKADFESTFEVQVDPGWKKENLNVVVFVQENEARKVIGVGRSRVGGGGGKQ